MVAADDELVVEVEFLSSEHFVEDFLHVDDGDDDDSLLLLFGCFASCCCCCCSVARPSSTPVCCCSLVCSDDVSPSTYFLQLVYLYFFYFVKSFLNFSLVTYIIISLSLNCY